MPQTTNKDYDAEIEESQSGDLKSDENTKAPLSSDQNLETVPDVINLDEYNDPEETYVIATIKGVPLFQEDLDCLLEGNEITDNIVGVFLRLINEQFRGIQNLTIAESLFYMSLTQNIALSGSVEQISREHLPISKRYLQRIILLYRYVPMATGLSSFLPETMH